MNLGDRVGRSTIAIPCGAISPIGIGSGVLKVDGKEVASQKMGHTLPLIPKWDENFDSGADTGTPVNGRDYQVPFKFNGKLSKLTLKIDRPRLSPADIKKLEQAHWNNKVRE